MTTTQRAVIWQADGEWAPGRDYAHRIAEHLDRLGFETEIERHADLPPGPSDLLDVDLLVLTGGDVAVHTTDGWMPTAIERVRAVLGGTTPVLGICLGSQMIAAALAGTQIVVPTPVMEVGMVDLYENAEPVAEFHYHRIDAAIAATPGVTVRDSSAACLVQEFTFGERAIGVQYHPELSPQDMADLVEANADLIRRRGVDPGDVTTTADWHGATFELLVRELVP